MTRRGIAALAATLTGVAVWCGACSTPATAPSDPTAQSAAVPLVPRTAEQIVSALQREGFDVDHPTEATDVNCAEAGCTQAVVTDRFRLLVFPSTGSAQSYAASQDMRQIETIAVGFAPVVPEAQRDRYWNAIVRLAR
ncbi:hypothetical protein [Mycolicibacterium poriferae]|uniref:hypothetical protein n=1 Tax=Mycolicibacterium poriferae TaxID=39694 RepID=UPI0024BA9778|nr:hypothetical protein [Mycolicibacterium poriferae]